MNGRGVIEAAFDVLDHVRALEPVRLLDLAEASGIPRPTVHRLLTQLIAVGAVRRDGKRYRLGASLLGFSPGGQIERRLRTVAKRPLAELAARTGAGAALSIDLSGAPVVLDFLDAQTPLGLTAEPGSPVPPGTAQARAHEGGLPIVDAGGVLASLSCVAVPVSLPGQGTAAFTTYVHGSRPSPSLLVATKALAARVSGLLVSKAEESTQRTFHTRHGGGVHSLRT
ncbi:helix-turn-helix domain-containing protein [Kibdelosporangium aridum]|uniref:helix-turn-helix domain-containing protein n=1 Tax=Kibdelosporangium aridum TaxID=2030 RepID=UPI0035E602D4